MTSLLRLMLMDGDVETSLIIWDAWSEKEDNLVMELVLHIPANFSILPVNDRVVLPFIAHTCGDHLIVVIT